LVPFPSPIASQLSDFGRPRASSCNDTPYEGEITTARLKLKSRYPWLEKVGEWLAGHPGGVVSCSALKRKYRNQLRTHCPRVEFLHLNGSPELICSRLAARSGHFMPDALLRSQFDTLEPLGADEAGVTVDIGQSVEAIIDGFLAGSAAPKHSF
jgi:gluconokinase